MSQRMVALKNMIDSQVSVRDLSIGVNRRWQRRGQVIPIPYEAVEQLLWQDGFRRMIDQGVLYIENMRDKQDLGLEPMNVSQPTNIIALNEEEIVELLKAATIDDFKKTICSLSDTQIDSVIDYAISHKIVDAVKCTILKQVTGRDILGAISAKEKNEYLDKQEELKAARMSEGRRI